ncbi:MAG: peptide ABC transporter substrate-binding protein [Clostridia bacterium]|nr:peptide ABC transporter substrate-binding protein [Clostridia bacterium]
MKNTRKRKIKTDALRLAAAALCLFILALPLSACSRVRQQLTPTAEPQATQQPPATEVPAPVSGGRLRMPMPENISIGNIKHDPLLVSTEDALRIYSLVFEPLIAVDESNSLIPCLASRWSASQHEANCWQVYLREGVTWHDGAKLTADDVIYSWQELGYKGRDGYYAKSLELIESITKLDDMTVIVMTSEPGLMCLYGLNFPITRSGAKPFTGTGPYRVTSYGDSRISLSVNTDWWDRPPYIEKIDFYPRDSNETALASYSAGQLDFVPTAKLAAGQYAETGVTAVRDYMTQGMETLLFNHRRSKLANADLRRAIALGINRSRLITNVYMNHARSCDVPVPPDSWLYNSGGEQINYDPASAGSLLDGLGYALRDDGIRYFGSRPLELTLLVGVSQDNTIRSDAASAIAKQLGQLGITVEIVTASQEQTPQGSEFMTALRGGEWDIALVGFNLSRSNDLSPYLTLRGQNNYGGYTGGAFDDLLREAAAAPDEESLRAAYYAIQDEFVSELPFIVLYFRLNSLVCKADLLGIETLREPVLLRNIKNWYLPQ